MKIVELKLPPVIIFDYRNIGGEVVVLPVPEGTSYRDGNSTGQLICVNDEEYERIKEHVERVVEEGDNLVFPIGGMRLH